jgi:carbon monoxide dehydrogenase subunit G
MSTFQFQGEERFDAPRAVVWEFLTDLRNVSRCAPNLQDVQFPAPDTLTAKLVPDLSFVKGALDLKMELKERESPQSARLVITARGMGSEAVVDAAMQLTETARPKPSKGKETSLQWKAQASLSGLLSAIGKGLAEGAAKQVIADVFGAIRRELAASPSARRKVV